MGPILVPLDGSPFSEHALPLATALAQAARCELDLAQVFVLPAVDHDVSMVARLPDLLERGREAAHDYLEKLAGAVRAQTGLTVSTALLEGKVAEALKERARQRGARLIVMTTHGRGALARFWLGSTADKLMRDSEVPLLLLRPPAEAADLGPPPRLEQILVPLDGSALAEKAVEPASWLALALGARLVLVQVIPHLAASTSGSIFSSLLPPDVKPLEDQACQTALAYLEAQAAPLRDAGLPVQTEVVLHEYPASAILETAAARAIDLIALASHGRGGLGRLFLGSVADKVVRGATTPVLVVRPE